MRRLVVQGEDDMAIIAALREIHGNIMLDKRSKGTSVKTGAKWWLGDEGTLHVIKVLDESVVVLNGKIVYNDYKAKLRFVRPDTWTVDRVAEAIGQQLGLKVIHIDATEIAERDMDINTDILEWDWPEVIKEAMEMIKQ